MKFYKLCEYDTQEPTALAKYRRRTRPSKG